MPCDTIQTVNVDLGKVDLALLGKALESQGYSVEINQQAKTLYFQQGMGMATKRGIYENGQLKMYGRHEMDIPKLKVEYSRQVVLSQAKKYGFQVKQDAKNPQKYQLVRR